MFSTVDDPRKRIYGRVLSSVDGAIVLNFPLLFFHTVFISIAPEYYPIRRILHLEEAFLGATLIALFFALPYLNFFLLIEVHRRAKKYILNRRDLLVFLWVLVAMVVLSLFVYNFSLEEYYYDSDMAFLHYWAMVLFTLLFWSISWVRMKDVERLPTTPGTEPGIAYDFNMAIGLHRKTTISLSLLRISLILLFIIGFAEMWDTEYYGGMPLTSLYILLSVVCTFLVLGVFVFFPHSLKNTVDVILLILFVQDLIFFLLPMILLPTEPAYDDELFFLLLISLILIPTSAIPFISRLFMNGVWGRWYKHLRRGGWVPGMDYFIRGLSSANSIVAGFYLTVVIYISSDMGDITSPYLYFSLTWAIVAFSVLLLSYMKSPLAHTAPAITAIFTFVMIIRIIGVEDFPPFYLLPSLILAASIMGIVISKHTMEEGERVKRIYLSWLSWYYLHSPFRLEDQKLNEDSLSEKERGDLEDVEGVKDYLLVVPI
ncbi:MAG: hypothetical protein J7L88_00815 [Thermoplasmata archaeon]|nr:hypothetical protein [Thermoplasmata archaeon]